ncbi:anhydro-N-acetylmuramic acid kinase [Nitrincola sp. MINF-07-Sa-05]|uniref:anhydro-N-acetylmuramic acid kinase n=1 Tax=Nitrincola salilacus TaxID=3400273 RepID=UPI003917BFF9
MSTRYFIGLMSGTSLDSVDAVLVDLSQGFQLVECHSSPITDSLRNRILTLTQPGDNEIELMGRLDVELANTFAASASALLQKCDLNPDQVIAIGSHGQTLRHRPEAGFTLQVGDPSLIAELTGITTVADFRRRDIAAGGQGAPLVPAFHHALFSEPGTDRIIINVGGMANLTLLPGSTGANVTGFDTGPGNVLMDSWIMQHLELPYDADGNWARQGTVVPDLLKQLLCEPFFHQPAPKSTGRELFNNDWLARHLDTYPTTTEPCDVQATLTELTAVTIADAITDQPLSRPDLYLCGGGSHNALLKERLQALLPAHNIATTEVLGIDPDWVESAAFAWLASRAMEKKSGNLPAVTGARGERILGGIYTA